ncbi:MAG: citrate synthase [Armatimonadetes bacterium]|nr:citrate synthase [Armatimonadota bacterium]MBS1700589.1 citrate synthase [Armatimonadota bacterium]MBS1728926.1 citrate synthase [Armatimonadota bacterium]
MSDSVADKYPNYSPGLEGVIAGISSISDIDSDRSSLQYRGYDVHDLAEKGSYEEVAFLLLYKKLPTQAELDGFKGVLAAEREIPEYIYDILAKLPKNTHPMDMVRTAYSALAPSDPDYTKPSTDHEANVRKAVRIIAKASTIVGNGHRIRQGLSPLKPNASHGIAENFLHLFSGETPVPKTVEVMDASLCLYAEHGFNASTFANRVTVSTLSDLYSGVVTGIGTLRGPLHGGANEEAMHMILEIGEPSKAQAWIDDAIANKKKIMGFGHREYKNGDSRAFYMSKVAKELGVEKGNTKFSEIADILETTMREKKGIFPNVDFPSAYAYYLLGIPIDLYTPLFVVARLAGYTSHAIEQLDGNRLIRPKCIYDGAKNLEYVPISQRQ